MSSIREESMKTKQEAEKWNSNVYFKHNLQSPIYDGELNLKRLEYPRLHLSLSECQMYDNLKEALEGERPGDDIAIEVFVRNWLERLPFSFYDNWIKNSQFVATSCF